MFTNEAVECGKFTAVLVSILWNVTPCTFVSRHQRLLGLATLKMEVGSSFEAFVPVYRSILRRVPRDGNSHSFVTTGRDLDS